MARDLDRLRLVVRFSDNSQASYPLELGAYTIGSNKGCTICLADDPQIEDIHAILTINRREIILENFADAGSLQLTGAPVDRKRSLIAGDDVMLGPYRLSLIELSPPHNSATCDLSPENRDEVDKLWSHLQRGLPGYDGLLAALRSVISPREAETARRATYFSLQGFGFAVGILVLLAVASATLPPSQPRLSALLYDLASAWALASALILIARYQVNFAGRVLLPLLWTLRFLEPPTSDWYELPHIVSVLAYVSSAVLLGVLLDFGASSEPGRSYRVLRRLALLLVGSIILYDAIANSRKLDHGVLFLYATAGIACMVWNWWPGPWLERSGRLESFDAQVLTSIGLRRWFRFTGGRCLALFLGVIPALIFLNSFHVKERLRWPKDTDRDPAIKTEEKEPRVWFWKHTGRLLRLSDFQQNALYGFLHQDVPKSGLQEIDRLAKRLADYPADHDTYQSLACLLSPYRLSTPSQVSRILSDVKLHPNQQSVYFLEGNDVKDRGPFRVPSGIFSARDQLALTWEHIQSFTEGEIARRVSNSGLRRFALMIYGFIGLLILWRRGGDWGYAFWLGLWFIGVGTIGTYRYHLFFFQALAHTIWRGALTSPVSNLLLTIFQTLDALVVVNIIAFASFLSCAATWNWICWRTDRRRWLKSFSARPWLGRILYGIVLTGKMVLVALIMDLCCWGTRTIIQIEGGNDDLALTFAVAIFVAASLGVAYWMRARAGKPLTPLYFVSGFLFLTAQALVLLSTPEVPRLSIRSTAVMTYLSYTLICGLIVIFLALVVRKNFLRLFTLRDASLVITASLIMVLLKLSEDVMDEGVKLFSGMTGVPASGSKILGLSAFVLLVPPAHRRIERLLLHLSLIKLNLWPRRPICLLRLRQIEEKIATALELLLNTRNPRGIGQIRGALSACGINEYTFMSRTEGRIFVNSVSCSSSAQPDQLEISDMLLEFFRKHRAALDLEQLPYEWSLFFVQFELDRLRMERPAKYLIPIKLGESLRGLLFVSKTSDERVMSGEGITVGIAEIALLTTQLRYQHFTQP